MNNQNVQTQHIASLKKTTMTIIDSTITSLNEILEKVGDLKRGESLRIQCKSEDEWVKLPARIKSEYPWSNFRAVPTMDDVTRIVKVKVIR